MKRVLPLLIFMLLLTMIEPGLGALALSLLAVDGRRLHPKLLDGLSQLDKKLVIANNRPFIDADLTTAGVVAPVSCIKDEESLACKSDRAKKCVNADTYLAVAMAYPKEPSRIMKIIDKKCTKDVLPKAELEKNIAAYFRLIESRLTLEKSKGYQGLIREMQGSLSGIAADKQYEVQLLSRTIQRGFVAVQIAIEKGVAACADMAGLTYLELLNFQKETGARFPIHRVEIEALKGDGSHFNHVFLLINAPKELRDGGYIAKLKREGGVVWEGIGDNPSVIKSLKGIYVLDWYYKNFYDITSQDAKTMHQGVGATKIKVIELAGQQHIEALRANPGVYGKFAGVFENRYTAIGEDFATLKHAGSAEETAHSEL